MSLEWTTPEVNGTPPSPRWWHTASTLGNSVYFFGGESSGKEDFREFNEVFELDTGKFQTSWTSNDSDSMTWKKELSVSGISPSPRTKHAACIWNNKLWIVGGEHDFEMLPFGVDVLDLSKTCTMKEFS